MSENNWLSAVRFGPDGLVPVVAQERRSGDVLMLAYADREALERTLSTGFAHYYSRSRKTLWRKGETSGHEQRVAEIRLDCDGDAVLFRVEQTGPACHSGTRSCFARAVPRTDGRAGGQAGSGQRDGGAAGQRGSEWNWADGEDPGGHVLSRLNATIAARAAERPAGSYTVQLLDQGVPKISQKVGEEAVELVVAANAEDETRVAAESADLLYHLLVLLRSRNVSLDAVLVELENRTK